MSCFSFQRLGIIVVLLCNYTFSLKCTQNPCDSFAPSQSNTTFASKCIGRLKLFTNTSTNSNFNFNFNSLKFGDTQRIKIFWGVAILGDPVKHGLSIALAQLESLILTGLLCEHKNTRGAQLYVSITHAKTSSLLLQQQQQQPSSSYDNQIPSSNGMNGENAIILLRKKINEASGGNATIRVIYGNHWEWPAISELHKWSTEFTKQRKDKHRNEKEKDYICLYFHNKGASHITESQDGVMAPHFNNFKLMDNLESGYGRRTLYEMAAFHEVVAPWRHVLALFDYYGTHVQHIGLAPALNGFQWFNFWWARPGYIASRLAPQEPHSRLDRHYYEGWLGKAINKSYIEEENKSYKQESLFRTTKAIPTFNKYAVNLNGKLKEEVGEGCVVAYSLSDCAVGKCGQAKWAESKLRTARKNLDVIIRKSLVTP
mmetsp:Transcript_11480/g.13838  ORF Transcript_11480/g.13838 Transcript_11480/m.13838 type:complete len:428 (+) Transcript_11480:76-1359(+)